MSNIDLRLADDLGRVAVAKAEAQESGRELVTPGGTAKLFLKSGEAVRKATSKGHVRVVADLWATEKNVGLIDFESACRYWGRPDPALVDVMRSNGHTLAVGGVVFNVLHHRPLTTLREPEELESSD
ncbi:MAG: hypothetical protein OXC14_14085 [Rhodospirillaceae bacterium]|nr:hypothetical protein [Rhodospirillaceae bacterium]